MTHSRFGIDPSVHIISLTLNLPGFSGLRLSHLLTAILVDQVSSDLSLRVLCNDSRWARTALQDQGLGYDGVTRRWWLQFHTAIAIDAELDREVGLGSLLCKLIRTTLMRVHLAKLCLTAAACARINHGVSHSSNVTAWAQLSEFLPGS